VLVLVLLTILSLGLGAMFADAGANLTMSTVVTGQDNKVYAADGGVEYALQQLRTDGSLCAAAVSLPNIAINGRSVLVSCTPTAGLGTSVSPWALVTTNLSTSGGPQTIDGPVSVSGAADLQSQLTTNGDFRLSTCPLPPNLTVTPPFVPACPTMPMPDLDPGPSLPQSVPTATPSPAQPAYLYNGCSIWEPGTYRANGQLALGPDNYFASGIYYFEDTSINLSGQTAIGGQPGPDYQQAPALPPTACSSVTDKTAGVPDGSAGSGVELILGGTSTVSVNDAPAQLELFARVPASPVEGTPGISIRTVPSGAPTGWKPTTSGHRVVLSSSGSKLAVHGYVYVPEASVSIHAAGNFGLAGGLYCWQATLNSSGGVPISAQSGAQSRDVVITSEAKGDPGQKDVTSTAVVAIGNDAARTIDVHSWVTNIQ
jgi:hypothetical protein